MWGLRRLVDFDKYNVYTVVCEILGLAGRVSKCTYHLPIIAKGTNDTEIVIRGVSLLIDQIRDVYQEALSRCEALMDKLLLGLQFSQLAFKDFDNFSNTPVRYQLMADRNWSIDEEDR